MERPTLDSVFLSGCTCCFRLKFQFNGGDYARKLENKKLSEQGSFIHQVMGDVGTRYLAQSANVYIATKEPRMRGFGKSCLDTTARFILAGLLNLNVNTIKRLAVLFLFLLGCLAPKAALANDVSYAVKKGYLMKCWKFETEKNKFEQPGHPTLPYYSLCLRNKNQAVGVVIGSEGHGRDFEYKWYLIKGPYIILSPLGSGLIDHIQKITVAAMQMADMKVCAHRS